MALVLHAFHGTTVTGLLSKEDVKFKKVVLFHFLVITWHPTLLSAINFYILIFFPETTGPIEAKPKRNVHWMVPNKVYVLFC
jgi:hypothetical protein